MARGASEQATDGRALEKRGLRAANPFSDVERLDPFRDTILCNSQLQNAASQGIPNCGMQLST